MNRSHASRIILLSALFGAASQTARAGDDPFADIMVSYEAGKGAEPGYDDPNSAIGSPERMTGEVFRSPGVVSPFNPCWGTDEAVSLGAGGQLTLQFDTPVTDDPNNLYGIDLIIFGNAGFINTGGLVTGMFGNDGGVIELSANGSAWVTVPAIIADGPFPTLGYFDSGPFDPDPGSQLSDFTRPVDPLFTAASFEGLTFAQVIGRYHVSRSGGGAGIDLASVGLSRITHVRVSNPLDAQENVEVEAMSDVSPRLSGDVNLDGLVNLQDLLAVIGAWGTVVAGTPPADFDLNGVVNIGDLLTVIAHWGA